MPLCSQCGSSRCGCAKRERPRATAAARGYDHRWREARQAFLMREDNRICNHCKCRLAEHVDHIKPHRGDPVLFWDINNWQPLCESCHGRKTRREDQTDPDQLALHTSPKR